MWISGVKNKVFTVLQVEARKKLPSKYQNTSFTAVGKSTVPSKFPNVYFQKLQGSEVGRTLSMNNANLVWDTYQIDVYDNASQDTANDIADIIADVMISMGFEMVGEPFPNSTDDAFRNSSRWRRLIGQGNKV